MISIVNSLLTGVKYLCYARYFYESITTVLSSGGGGEKQINF